MVSNGYLVMVAKLFSLKVSPALEAIFSTRKGAACGGTLAQTSAEKAREQIRQRVVVDIGAIIGWAEMAVNWSAHLRPFRSRLAKIELQVCFFAVFVVQF